MKDINRLLESRNKVRETDEQAGDLEEVNVTANIDGGEGPPKTPNAFNKKRAKIKAKVKSQGYKIADNLEEDKFMEDIESILSELSYKNYKKDDSLSNKQKLNRSLVDIYKKLREVEQIIGHNYKLKSEFNLHDDYWKSSMDRIRKISEKIIVISNKVKSLSK